MRLDCKSKTVVALLIALLIPALAHAAEAQFNIYYSGTEDLVPVADGARSFVRIA